MTQEQPSSLTRGRRLAHNSVLTLATGLALLMASVLITPLMLDAFGNELFGVLAITWMVLAHLAWLDLGFSRASAKFVAHDLAIGRLDRAATWAWTAVATQSGIGVLGGAVLFALAPLLADSLKAEPRTRDLVVLALQLFACAIPLDLCARSFIGVMQAGQRFLWINSLSVLVAVGTYSAYLVGIWRDGDFRLVLYGLVALRAVNLLGAWLGAARVVPGLRRPRWPGGTPGGYRASARKMLGFGTWVTVATLIGPLILFVDQWLIGVLIGVAALPFYVVPFTLLSRLAILPTSVTSILFPTFSALEARRDWSRIEAYYLRAHRYLLTLLLPLSFVLFVWAPEVLRLWIDADFAAHAATPLRILVIGFCVGLLAPLSGALLEGVGRPDVLAKVYAIEAPLNVASVALLTHAFGLAGAAWSFTIRTVVETLVLWAVVSRLVPLSAGGVALFRRTVAGAAVAVAGLVATAYVLRQATLDPGAVAGTVAVLGGYGAAMLAVFLDDRDRSFVRSLLRRG